MKPVLAFIKKWWGKFVTLVKTPEWLFIFPALIFAAVAIFKGSILMVIVLAIWLVTIAYNKKEKQV